jgi:hypothetical protein
MNAGSRARAARQRLTADAWYPTARQAVSGPRRQCGGRLLALPAHRQQRDIASASYQEDLVPMPPGSVERTARGKHLGHRKHDCDVGGLVLPLPRTANDAGPSGDGYWLLGADGAVTPFGAAISSASTSSGSG